MKSVNFLKKKNRKQKKHAQEEIIFDAERDNNGEGIDVSYFLKMLEDLVR